MCHQKNWRISHLWDGSISSSQDFINGENNLNPNSCTFPQTTPITTYLPLSDLGVMSQVDRRWESISRKELNSRVTFTDRIIGVQRNLVKELANHNLSSAFAWLNKGFEIMRKADSNYLSYFLQQAEAITRGQQLSITIGTEQEKASFSQWSSLLYTLRQHNASQFDRVLTQHLKDYINSDRPLKNKLEIINFLNSPTINTWPMKGKKNYYYNPKEAQELLDRVLRNFSTDESNLQEATLFVLRDLSPFNPYCPQTNYGAPAPLSKTILHHLAVHGNPWHKILYAVHYSGHVHLEPIRGDGMKPDEIKKLFEESPDVQAWAIQACQWKFEINFSSQPEEMLRKEEVLNFLSLMFSEIIGYKNLNTELEDYIKAAVDQIIQSDNSGQAIALLRLFSHKGGQIQFFENNPDLTDFIDAQNLLGYADSYPQARFIEPYIEKLQNYLSDKKAYNPAFISGSEMTIQELSELTPEQISIVTKLYDSKRLYQKPSIDGNFSTNGSLAQKESYYGPFRLSGSLVFNQGGLEVATYNYVVDKTIILNAPAYIKVKEFTLLKDFDARDGAVIVAEKFNLDAGNIWNPQNCHLIKVPKVKLDASLDICE